MSGLFCCLVLCVAQAFDIIIIASEPCGIRSTLNDIGTSGSNTFSIVTTCENMAHDWMRLCCRTEVKGTLNRTESVDDKR
jgi:hypothetical protein